jgi:hypothetical protein
MHCGKCGQKIFSERGMYWRDDEPRHRICPSRKAIIGSRRVRMRYGRDQAATLAEGFTDPNSYVTKDGRHVLKGEDWTRRVWEVFERDGRMCHWKVERDGKEIICGEPAAHPHHVIRRSIRHDSRMENLIAICEKHHKEAHPEKQTRFTKRSR